MAPDWEIPSDLELTNHLNNYHQETLSDCLERYKFIWGLFGPPQNYLLLGGTVAYQAFQEMKICYIEGHFQATIYLAQTFVEHTLGTKYIMAGKDRIAESGFYNLIENAHSDKIISPAISKRLHELRKMRNPYTHPHAGAKPRSFMARLLNKIKENEHITTPEELTYNDAKEAIIIVTEYIHT